MISFWERIFYEYDIAIIGAGITGLSLGSELLEKSPNLKIVILEKSNFPDAASTRNAGFACFGSLTELISDSEKMGHKKMLDLVEKRWKGLNILRTRLGDKKIDYEPKSGFEILSDKQLSALDKLEEINHSLSPIFNQQVFELRNDLISKFGFNANWCKTLVKNSLEGQLNSGKMIAALRQYFTQLGGLVLYGNEMLSFEQRDEGIGIQMSDKSILHCRKMILCTNAYTANFYPEEDIKPGRGLVLLTNKIDLKFEGAFHFDEGFYYFRDLNGRILIGGGRNTDFEGERTFEKGINEKVKEAILEKTSLILNGRDFEEDYWWSGIMAFGDEKVPIVKKKSDDVWLAARLSGMGVALASQIAFDLSSEILEELK